MTRSLPLGRVTIGLAILALIVAAVLAGHAIEAGRAETRAANGVRVVTVAPKAPLAAALERCRLSGPASGDDPACRAAWSEARESFFSRPLPESSDE
jgi:conjugative transfer region protein TrbK